MIEGLKPYPMMRDSGVPWLGAIPEHWQVRRLRHVVDMRVSNVDKHIIEGERPVRLCNYVDVYKNERIRSDMPFMRASASAEEVERFQIQPGDVLITKDSETWDDIGVPALVEGTATDLLCGYHLALLRPNADRLLGAYLLRALQSKAVAYQFHVEANGVTRYGLSHAAIKSITVPLPPVDEQSRIVRFLDYADRRIRRYIRAKQKLIKLLEEQKQAIIHRAVTRGLNASVRLKPSGLWLGDVPEHWSVLPIKHAFESMVYGVSETATDDGTIRLLTMGHIKNGAVRVPDSGGLRSVEPDLLVETNDLLFNRTNSAELVGKVGLFSGADEPVTFASYLVRLRPNRDNNPQFLNFLLNDYSILSAARREAIPSLHQSNLNPTRYGRLRVAVPPLREQVAIVDYLNDVMKPFDQTMISTRREIDHLHEYRSRLFADVVTGKSNVLHAAERLPEEFQEPEHDADNESPEGEAPGEDFVAVADEFEG